MSGANTEHSSQVFCSGAGLALGAGLGAFFAGAGMVIGAAAGMTIGGAIGVGFDSRRNRANSAKKHDAV